MLREARRGRALFSQGGACPQRMSLSGLPAPAIKGAADEIRAAVAHAENAQKKAAKGDQLQHLSREISHNELTEEAKSSEIFCLNAKDLTEIVRKRKDAPPDPREDGKAKAPAAIRLIAPPVDIESNDRELLESTFGDAPTNGVLFIKNAGGSLENFLREHEQAAKADAKRRRDAATALKPAALPSAGPRPPKKPSAKKQSAASILAKARAVPSMVSDRYAAAQLPLYEPGTKPTTAGQEALPASRPEPGSRYLRESFARSHSAARLYQWAIGAATMRAMVNCAPPSGEAPRVSQPVLVRWKYVQEHAYVEALSAAEMCGFGPSCIGRGKFHPDRGSFAFKRWQSPGSSRMDIHCYACILATYSAMSVVAASSGSKFPLPLRFRYLVDVPGEYNKRAFETYLHDGATERVRNFCTTNLEPGEPLPVNPSNPDGPVRRRFVERSTLRYADGTRHIPTLPLVNPSFFLNFDVAPVTTEDILRTYVFNDIANRYAEAKREMPDWVKVCLIAFIPFEQTVALLVSQEYVKFMEEHMPADFFGSIEYQVGRFNLVNILREAAPHLANGIQHPSNTCVVYWATHIRINAALRLADEGFPRFIDDICGFRARDSSDTQQRAVPTTPIPDELGVTDDAIARRYGMEKLPPQESAWLRGSGQEAEEPLRKEMEAKQAQLQTFIESHSALVEHLKNELLKGAECVVDDEALLEPELWAAIKPQSDSYLGPLFPEDRRYSRFLSQPHLEYRPGASQMVEIAVRQWCQEIDEPAPDADPLVAQKVGCLSLSGRSCTWAAGAPIPLGKRAASAFVFAATKLLRTPIALSMVFSDFRELHWWVTNDASDSDLDGIVRAYGHFRDTWDYGAYHRKAASCIYTEGAAVWRKRYSILVTLLIRAHCARLLMNDLKTIYATRHASFHRDLLGPLESCRAEILQQMLKMYPLDAIDHEIPENLRCPYIPDLMELQSSMQALKETIYQLNCFINGHLPLAKACVVHCTAEDGEGPLDSVLYDTSRTVPPDCTLTKFAPSLFELNIPCSDAVMCEDNLPDCSHIESRLKVLTDNGISQEDPILKTHIKGAPIRCQKREAGKQLTNMAESNAAWSRYSIQTIYCTLLGGSVSALVTQFVFSFLLQILLLSFLSATDMAPSFVINHEYLRYFI